MMLLIEVNKVSAPDWKMGRRGVLKWPVNCPEEFRRGFCVGASGRFI